jgi:hypothetical protein
MKNQLLKNPTRKAKQLKAKLPALENIYIKTIQKMCLVNLKLPFRKLAPKPRFTQP